MLNHRSLNHYVDLKFKKMFRLEKQLKQPIVLIYQKHCTCVKMSAVCTVLKGNLSHMSYITAHNLFFLCKLIQCTHNKNTNT